MKKAKRMLALVLSTVLLLSLIPCNVYADENEQTEEVQIKEELQAEDGETEDEQTGDVQGEDVQDSDGYSENETGYTDDPQIMSVTEAAAKAPQPSAEGKTRYTVLLLDQSTSMSGEPMTNLKIAAKRFCEQIFKAKETNYVAVVSYGTYTNICCAFTDSYDETASAIDRIYLTGSTNITGAINTADNLLKEVQDGDNIIKNIVLLSDGLPERGESSYEGPYSSDDYRYYSYANAAYKAAEACKDKYNIYTLGFFHSLKGDNLAFGQRFMKDLQNGGYYEVTDPEDLEFVFGEVAGDVASEEIELQIHYVDASVDYPDIPATYSDEYFAETSYDYNHNLAWLSLCLELSSWTDDISAWGESVAEDSEIAKKRYANIQDAYQQMKFDEVQFYNYGDSLNNTEDKTAYSIGLKKGVNGSTLVAVMVRGGGYGAEWSSNFNVGNGSGNHIGFASAAEKIYQEVTSQLSEIQGDVKIWVSGYSRGAAVANILAAKLDDYAASAKNVSAEDIYAYTFATPQGVILANNTKSDRYKNIFNIVNPGDIVPMVAPSGWKYTRYGVTRYLDAGADKDTFSAVENAYYLFTRENDFKAKSNLNQSAAGSALMDLVLQTFPTAKSALKMQKVIQEFMEFTNTRVQSGNSWESIEADDFMAVLAKRYGDDFFLAMQYCYSFFDVTTDGKLLMSFIEDQSTKDMVYLFFTLCELHGIDSAEVVDMVLGLVKSENIENALLTYMFMPDGLGGIATAHTAAVYLSWMAMKEELTFGETMGTPKGTTIVSIACPVDIVVYDQNGEKVAVIEDHEQVKADIPVLTGSETTKLYLPVGEQFKIEITATDSGTMDYNVTEKDLEQTVINQFDYTNIPLRKGMVFTTQFDTGSEYEAGKYDLTRHEDGVDTIIEEGDYSDSGQNDTDNPDQDLTGGNSSDNGSDETNGSAGGNHNQELSVNDSVNKGVQTGDSSNTALLWVMLLLSAGVFVCVIRKKARSADKK